MLFIKSTFLNILYLFKNNYQTSKKSTKRRKLKFVQSYSAKILRNVKNLLTKSKGLK